MVKQTHSRMLTTRRRKAAALKAESRLAKAANKAARKAAKPATRKAASKSAA